MRILIMDWDDTAFPTEWYVRNEPDEIVGLKESLHKIFNNRRVYILTNATDEWVTFALEKYDIDLTPQIISARDSIDEEIVEAADWKLYVIDKLAETLKGRRGRKNSIVMAGDSLHDRLAANRLRDLLHNTAYVQHVQFPAKPTWRELRENQIKFIRLLAEWKDRREHLDYDLAEERYVSVNVYEPMKLVSQHDLERV